jgi:hypothetical protein
MAVLSVVAALKPRIEVRLDGFFGDHSKWAPAIKEWPRVAESEGMSML